MEVPSSRPIVLESSLLEFLDYIIQHHSTPTTLLVCSSRLDFLQAVLNETERSSEQDQASPQSSQQSPQPADGEHVTASRTHHLLSPTLALLSNSKTVSVAFVPSLAALRGYLSIYRPQEATPTVTSKLSGTRRPILAILNLISVHRSTGSFSAQGISRTIAGAVETAHRAGQQLVLVECPAAWPSKDDDEDDELGEAEADVTMHGEGGRSGSEGISKGPWDATVPILNTTMRLTGAGERTWVGRSVRVRQVAARWCSFQGP